MCSKWVNCFDRVCFGEFLYYLLFIPCKVLSNEYGRIFEFILWLVHIVFNFPVFQFAYDLDVSSAILVFLWYRTRRYHPLKGFPCRWLMQFCLYWYPWCNHQLLNNNVRFFKYLICFWRSWLDSFADLSFCDRVLICFDWFSMVSVRFCNADCIALSSVGVILFVV